MFDFLKKNKPIEKPKTFNEKIADIVDENDAFLDEIDKIYITIFNSGALSFGGFYQRALDVAFENDVETHELEEETDTRVFDFSNTNNIVKFKIIRLLDLLRIGEVLIFKNQQEIDKEKKQIKDIVNGYGGYGR